MNKNTPEDLIQLAQQGDQMAYGSFLEVMRQQITGDVRRGISNTQDQEELTQMTLLKIHQFLGSYTGKGSVRGWVRTITRNVIYDFYKGSKKTDFIHTMDDWSDEMAPGNGGETPETLAAFKESVMSIPEKQVEPLLKSKLSNMSVQELADEENETVGNYKVKIHRAKKAFVKYLSCLVIILVGK